MCSDTAEGANGSLTEVRARAANAPSQGRMAGTVISTTHLGISAYQKWYTNPKALGADRGSAGEKLRFDKVAGVAALVHPAGGQFHWCQR